MTGLETLTLNITALTEVVANAVSTIQSLEATVADLQAKVTTFTQASVDADSDVANAAANVAVLTSTLASALPTPNSVG